MPCIGFKLRVTQRINSHREHSYSPGSLPAMNPMAPLAFSHTADTDLALLLLVRCLNSLLKVRQKAPAECSGKITLSPVICGGRIHRETLLKQSRVMGDDHKDIIDTIKLGHSGDGVFALFLIVGEPFPHVVEGLVCSLLMVDCL